MITVTAATGHYGRLVIEELLKRGVPEALADLLADTSLAIAHGDWSSDGTDLHQLIGRPSTPLAEAVAVALKPSD